ncbi:MAG: hypothetical protein HY744_20545 [Deltaproteobacteria bacterium]|nr:hypothetical protein [Deltaproteobacteria bacterium]
MSALVAATALAGCSTDDTSAVVGTTTGTGGSGGQGAATGAAGHGGAGEGGEGIGGWSVDAGPPPFALGHVFVAGSRNAQVFEFDATLNPIAQFTHASFGQVLPAPGQPYSEGPAGMAFDASGYLVVAAKNEFCVFSGTNEPLACHPKYAPEPTENVIFDLDGNLYTTTATGGTDQVRKYDAAYQYVTAFTMPTGQLTGVTCDPNGNLYVASQLGGGASRIYKVDKASFAVLDTIEITGMIEGLQFAQDGNILVGLDDAMGVLRVQPHSPTVVVDTITHPNLVWAVPLTTDDADNVYTADYENGSGTAPADLFVFDPTGNLIASRLPSEVYGPFGVVVAGAVLPCGAFHPPR